jgi:membrane-associated phospholipid phosphatase
MQKLLELDRELFSLINYKWSNSFFDSIFPILRNQYCWVPLYLFLLVFSIVNFNKTWWKWVLFAALLATITNYISSDLIKEHIFRLRPANDPEFAGRMNFLLGYRPKSSSFTSSHATNHFGLAAFFYYTLKKYIGNWAWLFFIWAFVIIYAQVYVGVHFPLDVLAGAAIGFLFGYLCAIIFNRYFPLRQQPI